MWDEEGKLYRQSYYKDGELDGEYKWWDEDGNLIQHKIYKDGVVVKDFTLLN